MAKKKALLIRINPEMWKELNLWAQEDFRSLNGQIEFLLHKALRQKGRLKQNGEQDKEA